MKQAPPIWRKARRIDAHNHVYDTGPASFASPGGKLDRENAQRALAKADQLDIDVLCVSHPLTTESPTPEEVRRANDIVLEAMAFSPRFLGFCFVNPGYAKESLDEIERCLVDGGMVGIKLYHQYVICDPALRPVMDRAAALAVPVLMHAGKVMDSVTRARQPRLSHAAHFVKAAAMFPETMLIQGHIGGGGDWEWNLRVLETRPNTYIDISGSVIDTGIVDKTVAALGVDRVLFATDCSYEEGVGKLLEADLSAADRAKVFAGNLKTILARRQS